MVDLIPMSGEVYASFFLKEQALLDARRFLQEGCVSTFEEGLSCARKELAYERKELAYERKELAYERKELAYERKELAYERKELAYERKELESPSFPQGTEFLEIVGKEKTRLGFVWLTRGDAEPTLVKSLFVSPAYGEQQHIHTIIKAIEDLSQKSEGHKSVVYSVSTSHPQRLETLEREGYTPYKVGMRKTLRDQVMVSQLVFSPVAKDEENALFEALPVMSRERLHAPGRHVFSLRTKQKHDLVGFAWLVQVLLHVPSVHWMNFFIYEEHRNRGYGTAALKFMEHIFYKRGFRTMTLSAFLRNPRAISLYKREGYVVNRIKVRKTL